MNNIAVIIQDLVQMKINGTVSAEVKLIEPAQVNITDTVVTQTAIAGQVPVCTEIPFEVSNSFAEALAIKSGDTPLAVALQGINDLVQAILQSSQVPVSFNPDSAMTVSVRPIGQQHVVVDNSITVTLSDSEGGIPIRSEQGLNVSSRVTELPTIRGLFGFSGDSLPINATAPITVKKEQETESIFYVLFESVGGVKKSYIQHNEELKTLADLELWIDEKRCEFETRTGEDANILDYRFTTK